MNHDRVRTTNRLRVIVQSISLPVARSFTVVLALAMMFAPLGVASMAASHAMPEHHMENDAGVLMAGHCSDHGDSDNQNSFTDAEECAAACSGSAVCSTIILLHADQSVEVQSQSVITTPHGDLPDFELPPPRIA